MDLVFLLKVFPFLSSTSGADLEMKMGGFHLPETHSQLGVWGLCKPPVGQGQSLGGGPRRKTPEAPRISSFFYPKNTLKIVFELSTYMEIKTKHIV